ncbi:MAG: MFS transporter [Anaerolineaceae bacterium]|nr:MFS transporter [Anaerolineaceae bacterium]
MKRTATHLPFGVPRNLGLIALSMLIWGLGEGLFIFFLPLSLQQWDTGAVQIGGVLSLIGVMMALVQAPAGYLSDRFGTRPLILFALVLGIIAAVMMAAANTYIFFVIGLLTYGLTSLIAAPINSYISSQRDQWSVQRAVTFVSGAMQVGQILGPLLGGRIANAFGMSILFGCSGGLFLVSTVVIFFSLSKQPAFVQTEREAARRINPLSNPKFLGLLMIIFVTTFSLSVPQQLTSMFLENVHQLSIEQIGALGTAASVGTALIMFALGNLPPSLGMILGQLLLAGFALLMWKGQHLAVFYAGYVLVGGYRLYRSMALAFSQHLVRAEDIGLAYGLVESGNAAAVIFAPLAAGLLYDRQPALVYPASLIALSLTLVLHGLFFRKRHDAEVVPCQKS